jgi:hypothetical protein
VLLVACCVVTYPTFTEGTSGPLQLDFGQMFLSKMQQQLDALHAGQLLFWDPIAFGGTPFWPLPYAAPAYPPLLVAPWLRGTIGGRLARRTGSRGHAGSIRAARVDHESPGG